MDHLVVTPIQHMSTNICSNTLVTVKQVAVIEEIAKNKDINDEALKIERLDEEVEICNDLIPPQCLSVEELVEEEQLDIIEETAKNEDNNDEAIKLDILNKDVGNCNDFMSISCCSDTSSISPVTVKKEQVDIIEETAKNEDINDEAIKLDRLDKVVGNCNDFMSISCCSDTISISPVTVKKEQVDIIEEMAINEYIIGKSIKLERLDEDVENCNDLNPAQHTSINICSDTTSISPVTVKEEQVAGNEENTKSNDIIDEVSKFEAFDEEFEINNLGNITELSPDNGIGVETHSMHFYCDVCNKKTSNKYLLAKHLKVHTKRKPYLCNRCDRTFVKKSHYVTHIRVHTGEKPYSCNRCNKTFAQTSHLATHMRVHTGEKPYTCNRCDKTFTQKSNLLNHMRLHTGEKPYACNKCDKAFNQKCNLTRHIKRIHTKKEIRLRGVKRLKK